MGSEVIDTINTCRRGRCYVSFDADQVSLRQSYEDLLELYKYVQNHTVQLSNCCKIHFYVLERHWTCYKRAVGVLWIAPFPASLFEQFVPWMSNYARRQGRSACWLAVSCVTRRIPENTNQRFRRKLHSVFAVFKPVLTRHSFLQ